ncbi:MAG TPA: hypothetical protein VF916_09840 [Ktedonobacterales bacterium]
MYNPPNFQTERYVQAMQAGREQPNNDYDPSRRPRRSLLPPVLVGVALMVGMIIVTGQAEP